MLPTIGVVLTGGQSRRMGSPKALLRLPNGQTFLEHALALLSSLTETQIVAGGEPEIIGQAAFPHLHINDLHPDEGPLAGIEGALATRLGSGYLIIASDQPKLSVELLQRLLNGNADRIHAFESDGIIIPLPIYVPQSALASLTNVLRSANRSVRRFIEANNHELIPLPSNDLPILQSINTPEEYQALLAELVAPAGGRRTFAN